MTAKRKQQRPTRKPKSSLVKQLMTFTRRYVVMTEEQLLVVAVWVIHTHCVHAFEQTPYLSVMSPEKQCGKSRLLEILDLIVRNPWNAIVPSEAVVFRTIHGSAPTLLLDEIDTIFSPGVADRYEGLRAILNAGHRRGSKVPRCAGPDQEIEQFNVFCPKVLAGIGASLPDTVADRSIPIRLERRSRAEPLERFRRRDVKPSADKLRDLARKWAKGNADALRDVRPLMPEELSDRAQEGCEGLVAIADALGIGKELRAALIALLTEERLDDQESMRLRLLKDIRDIFERRERKSGRRLKGMSTEELLRQLRKIEEAPWGSYYGREMEPRDLATLLAHYNIRSTTLRFKDGARKGYKQDDLHDAWARYLP